MLQLAVSTLGSCISEHILLGRDELLRCDLENYSGESTVAVVLQVGAVIVLAGEQAEFRNTDLVPNVTKNEISAT